jgi:hypothetical protein
VVSRMKLDLMLLHEFLFDRLVITRDIIFHPLMYGLIGGNKPLIAVFSHFEHDPVPPVITYVYRKKFFMQAIHFSEIELPQMAFSFDEFGKLDIPVELDDHGEIIQFI